LSELGKQIESRSTAMELKLETTVSTFKMQQIDPAAARTLHDFATDALKSYHTEKIWIFDPGPTAGTT
jgi:hypothetical protein